MPKVGSEYVARMEDVLDLYAEPHDPRRPVVCFDESPTQLIGHARRAEPATPGTPARIDYEYVHNGTANLSVFYGVHAGWRHVEVTEQRTSRQFAQQKQALVDVHWPKADMIRVVLDNLSTHSIAALYHTFEPGEARRIARKLEFHYVPEHAGWLTRSKSTSAFSSSSAWRAALQIKKPWCVKSPSGKNAATTLQHKSNGCSP